MLMSCIIYNFVYRRYLPYLQKRAFSLSTKTVIFLIYKNHYIQKSLSTKIIKSLSTKMAPYLQKIIYKNSSLSTKK